MLSNNGYSVLKEGEEPLPYNEYHLRSMEIGDVDPSYSMLRYLADRFELNVEQRYWIAFLYATCYCGPTVFYVYNEFPDFENVHEGRLESWWKANKRKLYFQTDRRWIRSRDQFVDAFRSYKALVGKGSQKDLFEGLCVSTPEVNYTRVFYAASHLYQFGRFALFLYLEAMHVVTELPILPNFLDLKEADSCRNGLAFAINRPDLMNHFHKARPSQDDVNYLQGQLNFLVSNLKKRDPRTTIWNVETTLCAYKKYRLGDRFIGYYLDRQADEIDELSSKVNFGVDWSVLWQYREETFKKKFLREFRS